MIRKLIFLVCFAALIIAGRDFIKRYPKADKAVTSMTKEVQAYCKTGWKTTKLFYKKNVNKKTN